MMPLAPSPVVPVPTKPKIGFSIESLVGKDPRGPSRGPPDSRPNSSNAAGSRTSSPGSDKRARSLSPPFEMTHHHHPHPHRHPQHSPPSSSNVRCDSPASSPPPLSPQAGHPHHHHHHHHQHPQGLHPQMSNPFMDTLNSLKGIYAPEPTYGAGAMMTPGGLVAPQPVSCASLAHVQQHPGFPNLSPLFLGNIGTVGHHQLHREAYPLYPWLLSRQGRFLGHRFQGPDAPAFLLQPFRKPKRIRTAFSPSQLLKLEHAFEKNHYVVGAERKHLAQTLSLTETQVKVWFQNRRTKHKRLKQEEEQSQSSPPSPKKKAAPSADDAFVQDFETSATL